MVSMAATSLLAFGNASVRSLVIHHRLSVNCLLLTRPYSGKPEQVSAKLLLQVQQQLAPFVKEWEAFSGLARVTSAHVKVKESQELLSKRRTQVREFKTVLRETEELLSSMRAQLERVPHEDIRYPDLARETHELLRKQRKEFNELKEAEELERWTFETFTNAVNELRQAEQAYTERTKYWSIMASLVAATVGFMGSSLVRWQWRQRLRHLEDDLKALNEQSKVTEEKMMQSLAEWLGEVRELHKETGSALKETVKNAVYECCDEVHKLQNTIQSLPKRKSPPPSPSPSQSPPPSQALLAVQRVDDDCQKEDVVGRLRQLKDDLKAFNEQSKATEEKVMQSLAEWQGEVRELHKETESTLKETVKNTVYECRDEVHKLQATVQSLPKRESPPCPSPSQAPPPPQALLAVQRVSDDRRKEDVVLLELLKPYLIGGAVVVTGATAIAFLLGVFR